MQQRPAQSGLVFQSLLPVQAGLVGHKGPLAAAGGVQGPEIGLVALGKALLVQILAVRPVITDVGDEVAAHIAHLGVALVDEHDLIPVVPIAAPLHGDDPHVLPLVELNGIGAVKIHGAVPGAGAGADIDLVVIDIRIRSHAAQHGNDHARQKQQDQQRGNEPLDGIHFCHRGCHSGISSFPKQVKRTYCYHRLTRANTPASAPLRHFLSFSPWRAPARLRLKSQKALGNPSLAGAKQFCRAEMCPDKERPAGNTCRISKGLDAVWAHFCPSKPCLPLSIDGTYTK